MPPAYDKSIAELRAATTGDFHGTANDAIEFVTSGAADCGPGEEVEFLRSWQQGDLAEWPEYYEWLRMNAIGGCADG